MAEHNKKLKLKKHLCYTVLLPPLKQLLQEKINSRRTKHTWRVITAKADSGASRHFWRACDKAILQNIRPIIGPKVALPNGATIQATEAGTLPLRNLSAKAKEVQIFKGLKSASLISIGQLCDDGCDVHLARDKMIVKKNNDVILIGPRNYQDGLWDVNLTPHQAQSSTLNVNIQQRLNQEQQYKANVIIQKSQTKADLAKYLHATCWSPTPSTFLRAIKNGNFITWPGLTTNLIRNHLEKSVNTALGHLDQERKNLQTTKKIQIKQEDDELDYAPTYEAGQKTHDCFCMLMDWDEMKKAYLDLTGAFPIKSARGKQYFLVVYDHDSNGILAETLKTKYAAEIKKAWENIHKDLSTSGASPNLYIMDNEASTDLKSAMTKYKVDYQLVPPSMHRRNAAEKAIRTYKNHFITGLTLLDPDFPMQQWDRLVCQSLITLNHLRNARANPKLSAHAYLYGMHDFNRCPMAPPGTKVVVHSKPHKRASWDTHGIEGWYIGPSLEHYRCVKCYMPLTSAERDSDTVAFFPHKLPIPKVTTDDFLRQSVTDIISLLKTSPPSTIPSLQAGDATTAAIQQIAKLLNRHCTKPKIIDFTPQNSTLAAPISVTQIPTEQPKTYPVQLPRVQQQPARPTQLPRVQQQVVQLPRVKQIQSEIPPNIIPPTQWKQSTIKNRLHSNQP